jgi:hypothetical protein
MTCIHLQQLYELCQEHDLKLSGSDLIHVVCNQCGAHEVCPSTLMDEYDARECLSVDETVSDQAKNRRCSKQER